MTDQSHDHAGTPARRVAVVRTGHASRYLQQLCKHFGHKLPVEFDERQGRIGFSIGDCRLMAADGALRIDVEATIPDDIERLQDVVARHLVRFAFREELVIDWHEPRPTGPIAEHHLDDKVRTVLDLYHARMTEERGLPREAPGGRDGGQDRRMRAIGPDTGRFLNTLARSLPAPVILEIGTSFGYSGIWLAEAARASGGRLVTMELHAYKSAHAQEMSERAGLSGHVDFRVGDALELIGAMQERPDMVFLDCWKDLYAPCLQALLPKLAPGAMIVADNMIRPGGPEIRRYAEAVRAVLGMSSVLLPIGTGLEISRLSTE